MANAFTLLALLAPQPSLASALARSRSHALRSSPCLCSAHFAGHKLASLAASPACCSRLLIALRAHCPLLASLANSPAARCARLAFCSLVTAPPALLAASPAALASLAASPVRLLAFRSPPRLRLLASLAVSPARAAPPHSLRLLLHFWAGAAVANLREVFL